VTRKSKNGSHCGTPPAPCRNSTVGPRPARCSLIGTFLQLIHLRRQSL
jgi:hypothetical protein